MTAQMTIREVITNVIRQVADDGEKDLVPDFGDQSVLLESGLDSLDFAIVVAKLERQFGADPFTLLDAPIYPRTLSDLVEIYECLGRRAS